MEWLSRETREGQPLACAFDCQQEAGGLRVGLLFVREQTAGVLTLADVGDGKPLRLRLPAELTNLDTDEVFFRQLLEIV